jgi:hypothetical protein
MADRMYSFGKEKYMICVIRLQGVGVGGYAGAAGVQCPDMVRVRWHTC